MTSVERDKLKERFELCEKELRRAKNAISFWSQELGYVATALSEDKQLNFNDLNKGVNHNE